MDVSERAVQAIIGWEISSPAYYNRALRSPCWPGGGSGITVGIGYDLGQRTPQQVKQDWQDHLDQSTVAQIATLAGLRGARAQNELHACRVLSVPLTAAQEVFRGCSLPVYARQTAAALPGSENLPADCFGALVSISYNRGPGGWEMTDDRHAEMAAIRAAIQDGSFDDVPDLIRAMKRLWQSEDGEPLPNDAGLVRRREEEAELFEDGLAATAGSP